MNPQLQNANLNIGIQNLSPKQMLGVCIDIATQMLKELMTFFCQSNHEEYPFSQQQKIDFSAIANYVLEPSRLQQILSQSVKFDEKSMKPLAKSWLFELKYLRNCWAHCQTIDKRLALRGFETLGLLFETLGGDKSSGMYQNIEMYRQKLTISAAKFYV